MFMAEPSGGTIIDATSTDYAAGKNLSWSPIWTSRDPSDPNQVITVSGTGVVYTRSEVNFRKISDGTSKVYMVGEKYMSTAHYDSGLDYGDNEPGFSGANQDTLRTTVNRVQLNAEVKLEPDGPIKLNASGMEDGNAKLRDATKFGSAHSGGFNMAMCDGSVDFVSFDIDPNVHRLTGNRSDGLVTTE
jgi:prepilin-type processing-associated H-X9-DG protein